MSSAALSTPSIPTMARSSSISSSMTGAEANRLPSPAHAATTRMTIPSWNRKTANMFACVAYGKKGLYVLKASYDPVVLRANLDTALNKLHHAHSNKRLVEILY